MGERRRLTRENTLDKEVRCRTLLPDGTVLEGMVEDVSLGGTRISGATKGLRSGDEVRLVFVFLSDEKVGYQGVVRYIDLKRQSYGVEFTSQPQPIEVHDT